MNPASNPDYKRLISELVKKQMVILGPDITFAKVRNVGGLTLDQNGGIQGITGDPKTIFNELSNQFVELSSLIVKKTMESVLQANQENTSPASNISTEEQSPAVNQAQNMEQPTQNPQIQQVQKDVQQAQSIPSPDQKIDPLVQTVQMPDDSFFLNKKSEPPSFTLSELESLNKALKDESSQNTRASF